MKTFFLLILLLTVPLSSSNFACFKIASEFAGAGTVYEIHPTSLDNFQYVILNSKGLYHIEVNAASSKVVNSKTLIYFK